MSKYAEAVRNIDTTASEYQGTAESLAGFAIAYALLDVADAIREAGKR